MGNYLDYEMAMLKATVKASVWVVQWVSRLEYERELGKDICSEFLLAFERVFL